MRLSDRSPSAVAVLRILSGPSVGNRYELTGDEALVGRDAFCKIVLTSQSVSRQHARFTREASGYFVEDLGSLNGTFVNGVRISRRTELRDNDRIHIYETEIGFYADAENADRQSSETICFADETDLTSAAATPESVRVVGALDLGDEARLVIGAEAKLRAVLEITRRLGQASDVQEFLPNVLDGLFDVFPQADRGYIMLLDKAGELALRAVKQRRGEGDGSPTLGPISTAMARRLIADGEAILTVDDGPSDNALVGCDTHSQMSAPLVGPSRRGLGLVHLDAVDADHPFLEADLEVLVSVATVTAQALEHSTAHEARMLLERRERELATAREVQLHFLPERRPEIPCYRFFDFYRAADDVGGDYFDYVQAPDGRLAIAMGDVSGKGVSAALLMARLCSDVRFCVATSASPEEAVNRLNRALVDPLSQDRFVTFLLLVLDPRDHTLTIVNAGHIPPLLRHGAGGTFVELGVEESGPPLGSDSERTYDAAHYSIAPGDLLVMYTDGIREASNKSGSLFGALRARAAVRGGGHDPESVGRAVLAAVEHFCGGAAQSDDICLVSFGRDAE